MTLPEKQVENAIKAHVKPLPNSFIHKIHGGQISGKGWLDFVGAYRGVPFWIEIKSQDGTPSPAQVQMVTYLERCGYVTGIVASVAEFKELFKDVLAGCFDLDYIEEKREIRI